MLAFPRPAVGGMSLYTFDGNPTPDWGSSDWTLKGNAFWTNDVSMSPPLRLRLTPASGGVTGAAWLNTRQIAPTEDWSFNVQGNVNTFGAGGADAMGMYLQTGGPNVSDLSGLGTNFALVLDTYYNPGDPYPTDSLKLMANGVLVGALDLGTALEDPATFTVFASYTKATHTLSVQFAGSVNVSGSWTNLDLPALFGTKLVTVGLLANTGGSFENHDAWRVRVTGVSPPRPISQIVPPATVAATNWTYTFENGGGLNAPAWGSSDWTLNGNAFYCDDAGVNPTKRLRMTTTGQNQNGSGWWNKKRLQPTKDWAIYVHPQFTPQTAAGAGGDGLAVVLQTAGTGALMPHGGYYDTAITNLGNYLAITLDTWQNVGKDPYINSLNIVTSSGGIVGSLNVTPSLNSGKFLNVWVVYTEATSTLRVEFWEDGQAHKVLESTSVNLRTLFGSAPVTFGFTGQTGAATENHDILSTSISGTPEDIVTLTWPNVRGMSALVQESLSLAPTSWSAVAWSWTTTNQNNNWVTEVPARTNSRCLYRLIGQ